MVRNLVPDAYENQMHLIELTILMKEGVPVSIYYVSVYDGIQMSMGLFGLLKPFISSTEKRKREFRCYTT